MEISGFSIEHVVLNAGHDGDWMKGNVKSWGEVQDQQELAGERSGIEKTFWFKTKDGEEIESIGMNAADALDRVGKDGDWIKNEVESWGVKSSLSRIRVNGKQII